MKAALATVAGLMIMFGPIALVVWMGTGAPAWLTWAFLAVIEAPLVIGVARWLHRALREHPVNNPDAPYGNIK